MATVFRCRTCTAIISRASVDTARLYNEDYFLKHYDEFESDKTANSSNHLTIIRRFKRSGSILDYGCGTGIFLKVASEFDFTDNIGVDCSTAALEIAQSNVDCHDRLICSEDESLPDRRFGVITFVDSLAHIPDISQLLRNLIAFNLKPDGILFIRTPNINRSYYAYVRFLSFILPDKYLDSLYFVPKRLCLMNRRAIAAFLDSFDFEIRYLSFERDYVADKQLISFRRRIAHIVLKTIPRWLNSSNSMTIVARKRGT